MNWNDVIDQRDAHGHPTDLALACDAIADAGCDCDENEPGTCLSHLCERALRGQWERIAELEAEVARLRADLDVAECRRSQVIREGEAAIKRVAELEAEVACSRSEHSRLVLSVYAPLEFGDMPEILARLTAELVVDDDESLTGCEHRDCLGACDPDCGDDGCEERKP